MKINSTLLNRDFTLLEPPNVGDDKWDHKPLIDEETHKQARVALARQFPRNLVILFHNRKKLKQEEGTGHWYVGTKGGGSSSSNSRLVDMSTSSGANDLAHEVGHYLQLPHSFVDEVETVDDAAAKIKEFVDDGGSKNDGLNALDGDRHWVLDTPANCQHSDFRQRWPRCVRQRWQDPIPVTFADNSTKTYTLAPDRSLVMSYFKGCPGAETISPQQARRVRDGLEMSFRHELISVRSSFTHKIVGGATGTAGSISEVDIAQVRAGRVATAVRDGSGDLKVIVWDIENIGTEIARRGSGSAGGVGKIAVCSLGLNMLATAVSDAGNELKVILWRVEEDGDVTRLESASVNGEIKGVAASFVALYNGMATVSWLTDNTLRVDIWRVTPEGTIDHKDSKTTGKVNYLGPACALANGNFVTYLRDSENMLKPILWGYDKSLVQRGDSRFEASRP